MSLIADQWAFAKDVAALILQAEELDVTLTFGEAWRTPEQEAVYVKEGKSDTMHSNHMRRLAVDFNCIQNGELVAPPEELGRYWEGLSPLNRWGGRWQQPNDPYHFERNVPT